ncbi:MAG: DUF3429 domain-containing protein [Pseudomonadota bacterium]
MTSIPRTALVLSLAGLIPFVWSAVTVLSADLALWTIRLIGPRFVGPYVGLHYGAIILGFMSGVLWGFSTRLEPRQAASGYVLSVIPALWVFLTNGGGAEQAGILMMFGFAGILMLDWFFWRNGAAPPWWMGLRLMITTGVLICLAIGVFL